MSLAERALLVSLSVSQWTARKHDRSTSAEVAVTKHAVSEAGRYNKALLPASEALSAVHRKTTLIRQGFYQNTLPWGQEGVQLLPTENFFGYSQAFNKERGDWEQLVSRFVTEYPSLVQQAEQKLGDLFNEADYPDQSTIADKFSIKLKMSPVPTTDFRVQVSTDQLEEIRKSVEENLASGQRAATQAIWERLLERVAHMAERLADPSNIFHNTLLSNLEEQCRLSSKMNFTQDTELHAICAKVISDLTGYHPDTLRCDPDVRRAVAEKASNIAKEIREHMEKLS